MMLQMAKPTGIKVMYQLVSHSDFRIVQFWMKCCAHQYAVLVHKATSLNKVKIARMSHQQVESTTACTSYLADRCTVTVHRDCNSMSSQQHSDFGQNQALLLEHVVEKGFQLGSCLGTSLFAPLSAYRGRHSGTSLPPRLLRVLSRSAVVGTVVSGQCDCTKLYTIATHRQTNSACMHHVTGLIGAARVYGTPLTADGVEDRVYRLQHNQGQKRTDNFSRVGSAAGAAVFAARFGISGAVVVGGAAFGTSIGILAHVATHNDAQKGLKTGPANMVEELKHSD